MRIRRFVSPAVCVLFALALAGASPDAEAQGTVQKKRRWFRREYEAAQTDAPPDAVETQSTVCRRMPWYRRGCELVRLRNKETTYGCCCGVKDPCTGAFLFMTWPVWYPLYTACNFIEGCFRRDEYVNDLAERSGLSRDDRQQVSYRVSTDEERLLDERLNRPGTSTSNLV